MLIITIILFSFITSTVYCIMLNAYQEKVVKMQFGVIVLCSIVVASTLLLKHQEPSWNLNNWRVFTEIVSSLMIGFSIFITLIYKFTNKHIQNQVKLLKSACIVIQTNLKVMFLPIILGILSIGFLILWSIILAYLISSGNIILPKRGEQADPQTNS